MRCLGGGGQPSPIGQSQFLRILGDNVGPGISYTNEEYNELVCVAWKKFTREVGSETATKKNHTHQKYFIRKLKTIAGDPALADRAMRLQLFLDGMMIINGEPYKSLASLHRKIDSTVGIDDQTIISELESVEKNHGDISYSKKVGKPRILYSMMVR